MSELVKRPLGFEFSMDALGPPESLELLAYIEALEAENARMTDGLEKIRQWSEAYPETIFHVPSDDEWRRAHEAIKAAGMNGIDAFSADNMRHVIKGVREIVDAALKAHP